MKLSSEQFQFHDEIKVIRKKSGSRCGMLSRKGSVEIFFFFAGKWESDGWRTSCGGYQLELSAELK